MNRPMEKSGGGITQALAKFVVSTNYETIPPTAINEAKRAIMDCIGVAIAGSSEPASKIVTELINEGGEKPIASIFGSGLKASISSTALANGVMAHALDFDDSSLTLRGHPSAPLLPAVFAAGEANGITGQEALQAYIIGFEVECKVANGVHVEHYEKGWHPTSTLGTFASTAAAGKILRLTEEQMKIAFGIACSLAAGIKENFGTMTKPLHCGMAAKNGITAASLAKKGFSASSKGFEGNYGFCNLFCGADKYKPELIIDNLGNPFDIVSPGVIIKPYPCCGSTHSSIDALRNIVQNHQLKPQDIDRIEVGVTYLTPRVVSYNNPENPLQAKFSMQFCLSTVVFDGNVKLSHFTDSWVMKPEIREMMKKINMYVHPDLDSPDKLKREFSIVTVYLKNGEKYEKRIEKVNRKGSARNPLTWKELVEKYTDCVKGVLDSSRIKKSINLIHDLENVKDLRELIPTLTTGNQR